MGHRERLLAAARRCLVTRGYARTTARDLVAESGTNLGSIGYHFGSKDELLTLALTEAQADYVDKILTVVTPAGVGADGRARRRASWEAMVSTFSTERPLVVAFFEALVESERTPELRQSLAESYRTMRASVMASLRESRFASDEERELAATYVIAVCDGLLVQWLLDPSVVPSGEAVFDAAERFHARRR